MQEEQNNVPAIAMAGQSNLANVTDEMLSGLEEAKAAVVLNREYLNLKKGDPDRFLVTGLSEMLNSETGELTPTVVLMNAKKELFITASHMIVNATKDLEQFTPVEIEYTGDKKLAGKKTLKQYKITLLNA